MSAIFTIMSFYTLYAVKVGIISPTNCLQQTPTAVSDKLYELMYPAQKGNIPIDLSQRLLVPRKKHWRPTLVLFCPGKTNNHPAYALQITCKAKHAFISQAAPWQYFTNQMSFCDKLLIIHQCWFFFFLLLLLWNYISSLWHGVVKETSLYKTFARTRLSMILRANHSSSEMPESMRSKSSDNTL